MLPNESFAITSKGVRISEYHFSAHFSSLKLEQKEMKCVQMSLTSKYDPNWCQQVRFHASKDYWIHSHTLNIDSEMYTESHSDSIRSISSSILTFCIDNHAIRPHWISIFRLRDNSVESMT